MAQRKIVGIGETVLDIVFRAGQPQAAVPGGSTFNAMISLGRTAGRIFPGLPIIMISQIGDDPVADLVTSFMEKNGVRTDGMKRIAGTQSTVSMALLDESNNASYEFFRDSSTPSFKAGEITFNPGDIVLFGSFFAINPDTREETQRLVKAAKDAGAIIYYDINFRKSHLKDLETVRPYIEKNCALSDIVRGSSEDIGYLYGSSDASSVYKEHISRLCSTFICTRGGDTTQVFSPKARCEFEVPEIKTVSTIGAGDNFNAGMVYGLLKGNYSKTSAGALGEDDWKALVPVASRFSANVCESIYNYVDPSFADTLA